MKTLIKRPTGKDRDTRDCVELLRRWHPMGYTLRHCANKQHLDRGPREALSLARRAGLWFPDQAEIAERLLEIDRRPKRKSKDEWWN